MAKDSSASPKKPQKRFREDRASLRMHPDVKRALEFLADHERRTISQILELMVLDHLKNLLREEFDRRGKLVKGLPADGKFTFRDTSRRPREGV